MYFLPVSSTNCPVASMTFACVGVRKFSVAMPANARQTRTSAEQSVSQGFATLAGSKPTAFARLYSVRRSYWS